jgi:hypothetical protein
VDTAQFAGNKTLQAQKNHQGMVLRKMNDLRSKNQAHSFRLADIRFHMVK